jgi:hypothetical protein
MNKKQKEAIISVLSRGRLDPGCDVALQEAQKELAEVFPDLEAEAEKRTRKVAKTLAAVLPFEELRSQGR